MSSFQTSNLLDRWATMQRLHKGFRPTANQGLRTQAGHPKILDCSSSAQISNLSGCLPVWVRRGCSLSTHNEARSKKAAKNMQFQWEPDWSVRSFDHTTQALQRRLILCSLHHERTDGVHFAMLYADLPILNHNGKLYSTLVLRIYRSTQFCFFNSRSCCFYKICVTSWSLGKEALVTKKQHVSQHSCNNQVKQRERNI